MASEMVLLCEIWKTAANEYMLFLKRHHVECFGIGNKFKETILIYVDQDQYLNVCFEQVNFNENEKQLLYLLSLLETTVENCIELEAKLQEQLDGFETQSDNEEY